MSRGDMTGVVGARVGMGSGVKPRTWAERSIVALVVLVAALAIGSLIARGDALVLAGLVVAGAVAVGVGISATFTAAALALVALLQPPIGDIGLLPEAQGAELFIPLVLGVVAYQAIAQAPDRDERSVVAMGGLVRAIHLAVIAFGVVVAANLLRTKYLLPAQSPGVDRAYFDYAIDRKSVV